MTFEWLEPDKRYRETVAGGGERPSNLDKIFWPEIGLTKGDLLDYFDRVAPFILPVLKDRPLTVIRYPDGIGGPSFYQKNTPAYAPRWVRTIELHAESARRDVAYTVCNSKRTLMWLANQASIELHPWLSRVDRLERPDFLVVDLDPPEEGFEKAREIAWMVREVLDQADLRAAVKTSGAKGIHVFVPIVRRYDYRAVRAAAGSLGLEVERRVPDLATTGIKKADRRGRVFLDVARNGPGIHMAATYSPRARPGAPVSFPVSWDELESIRPDEFSLRTVPGLLAAEGDRWRALIPTPQSLPRRLLG